MVCRAVEQCRFDGKRACDRICAGSDIAHLGLRCLFALPQADVKLLPRLELVELLLGNSKHHVARTVLRQAHHGLPNRQHLADVGVNGSNHARRIGQQMRVAGLVRLHITLGFGLLPLRLGGLECGLTPL